MILLICKFTFVCVYIACVCVHLLSMQFKHFLWTNKACTCLSYVHFCACSYVHILLWTKQLRAVKKVRPELSKNKDWYQSAAKWNGKTKNWYQVVAKRICKTKNLWPGSLIRTRTDIMLQPIGLVRSYKDWYKSKYTYKSFYYNKLSLDHLFRVSRSHTGVHKSGQMTI